MKNITSSMATTTLNSAPNLSMNIEPQIKQHKKEEQSTHFANQQLPFTLQHVPEILSNIHDQLTLLTKIINATGKEPNTDIQAIKNIEGLIENISMIIFFDLPKNIDKLEL